MKTDIDVTAPFNGNSNSDLEQGIIDSSSVEAIYLRIEELYTSIILTSGRFIQNTIDDKRDVSEELKEIAREIKESITLAEDQIKKYEIILRLLHKTFDFLNILNFREIQESERISLVFIFVEWLKVFPSKGVDVTDTTFKINKILKEISTFFNQKYFSDQQSKLLDTWYFIRQNSDVFDHNLRLKEFYIENKNILIKNGNITILDLLLKKDAQSEDKIIIFHEACQVYGEEFAFEFIKKYDSIIEDFFEEEIFKTLHVDHLNELDYFNDAISQYNELCYQHYIRLTKSSLTTLEAKEAAQRLQKSYECLIKLKTFLCVVGQQYIGLDTEDAEDGLEMVLPEHFGDLSRINDIREKFENLRKRFRMVATCEENWVRIIHELYLALWTDDPYSFIEDMDVVEMIAEDRTNISAQIAKFATFWVDKLYRTSNFSFMYEDNQILDKIERHANQSKDWEIQKKLIREIFKKIINLFVEKYEAYNSLFPKGYRGEDDSNIPHTIKEMEFSKQIGDYHDPFIKKDDDRNRNGTKLSDDNRKIESELSKLRNTKKKNKRKNKKIDYKMNSNHKLAEINSNRHLPRIDKDCKIDFLNSLTEQRPALLKHQVGLNLEVEEIQGGENAKKYSNINEFKTKKPSKSKKKHQREKAKKRKNLTKFDNLNKADPEIRSIYINANVDDTLDNINIKKEPDFETNKDILDDSVNSRLEKNLSPLRLSDSVIANQDAEYLRLGYQVFVPEDAQSVLEKIEMGGFRAFIVGGFPRDALARPDLKPNDFDIVTDATEEYLKVALGPNITESRHVKGLYPFQFNQMSFDICIKPKGFNLFDDAIKRDLTVNAIYCDKKGQIYTTFYAVLNDIATRQLKVISINDEIENRFQDDPVKMLRVIQLKNKLSLFDREWTIHQDTYFEIRKNIIHLKDISYGKLVSHLGKMFLNAQGFLNFQELINCNIFDVIFRMDKRGFSRYIFENSILYSFMVKQWYNFDHGVDKKFYTMLSLLVFPHVVHYAECNQCDLVAALNTTLCSFLVNYESDGSFSEKIKSHFQENGVMEKCLHNRVKDYEKFNACIQHDLSVQEEQSSLYVPGYHQYRNTLQRHEHFVPNSPENVKPSLNRPGF